MAEKIIKENLPTTFCSKIASIGFMQPSSGEERAYCYYSLAQLTRDPHVCELLMPGEYGLFCINQIMSQEYKDNSDAFYMESEECGRLKGPSLKYDRCLLLKAHRSHNPRDCDQIGNNPVRIACQLKMEAWHKYPELQSSFYFGHAQEGSSSSSH